MTHLGPHVPPSNLETPATTVDSTGRRGVQIGHILDPLATGINCDSSFVLIARAGARFWHRNSQNRGHDADPSAPGHRYDAHRDGFTGSLAEPFWIHRPGACLGGIRLSAVGCRMATASASTFGGTVAASVLASTRTLLQRSSEGGRRSGVIGVVPLGSGCAGRIRRGARVRLGFGTGMPPRALLVMGLVGVCAHSHSHRTRAAGGRSLLGKQ